MDATLQATFRQPIKREPVLFINTGAGVFEPTDLIYRSDVYSYDCETMMITFRDGTTGYYPEALDERDM